MTGFAPSHNVREDIGNPVEPSDPSVSSCDCNPTISVFCGEGKKLRKLFRRGERIAHQYGSRTEVNSALADLADHLKVDRVSALLAASGITASGQNDRFDARPLRRIP